MKYFLSKFASGEGGMGLKSAKCYESKRLIRNLLLEGKFKSINVKGNLTIWIEQFKNLEEYYLLKKEVEEIGQQSESLDSENRELEQQVEILKDPNNACECIMV